MVETFEIAQALGSHSAIDLYCFHLVLFIYIFMNRNLLWWSRVYSFYWVKWISNAPLCVGKTIANFTLKL